MRRANVVLILILLGLMAGEALAIATWFDGWFGFEKHKAAAFTVNCGSSPSRDHVGCRCDRARDRVLLDGDWHDGRLVLAAHCAIEAHEFADG